MQLWKNNILEIFFLCLIFLSTTNSKNVNDEDGCNSAKSTLQLIHEQRIVDSFTGSSKNRGGTKIPKDFEASDVILRTDGQVMYVVFDNTFQIGAFCTSPVNCTDQLLNWPDESVSGLASEFEGIGYNSLENTYFVVQEAVAMIDDKKKFQPNIFEIRIGKNDSFPTVQILESCRVEMEFDSDSKGFEGFEFVIRQKTGKTYLFGLCEANKCASSITDKTRVSDLGNGRIVVLEKKEATKKNPCVWKFVDKIHLPSSIQFIDYSAISIYHQKSDGFPTYIAITSQENSQVWIGLIEEIKESPFFEISSLKKSVSYDLPRVTSNKCPMEYCNIEGVAWQNENQLILVSDKSKKDQDARCKEKEESIHYFAVPKSVKN